MTLDLDRYRVHPGKAPRLDERDPRDDQGLDNGHTVERQTAEHIAAIDQLQERLYAENQQALLVVLQAMDGAGKDSTLRNCFGPLDPQGFEVTSFKVPTEPERARDFLWRVHAAVPPVGHIGVFNRSHYEDVLVVRVHGLAPSDVIERRYDHLNAFERLLHDEGTRVVKIMLHISKDYQLERMKKRLGDPEKHWKFNPGDLKERARWDDYQAAYETALTRCSTDVAPWYVIPAEKRWFRDLAITQLVRQTLEAMNPQFPPPTFNPADFPPDTLT